MADMNLPPNIENYARVVADLQGRDRLSAEQKKKLALCKLKIALWSCKTEGIPMTRYALAEVLGPDTSFVFQNAQSALLEIQWESAEDRAAMRALVNSYKIRGKNPRPESEKKPKKGSSNLGTYQ